MELFDKNLMIQYMHYIQAWAIMAFVIIWLKKPEYVDAAFFRLVKTVFSIIEKVFNHILKGR